MSRSERLFALLDVLRQHRRPVTGQFLAAETGVSLRTLYRDIASLQAMGAMIEGEAGLGYVLKPGFLLPPLMFSAEEIEALVLGVRWVSERADSSLQTAAQTALARIATVLPADLRDQLNASALLIGPGAPLPATPIDLSTLRRAIRQEHKVQIVYQDAKGVGSDRLIWPFALAFFDSVRILLGWCEIRQDFRHFRTDRIQSITLTNSRYPKRRQALLQAWRRATGISNSNQSNTTARN